MEVFLVVPVSGKPYTLEIERHDDLLPRVCDIIGCTGVECVRCDRRYGGYLMLVDDCGAICNPPKLINRLASMFYAGSACGNYIHGTAVFGVEGFYGCEPDIVGLQPRELYHLLARFQPDPEVSNG